jgi:tetratricopeptide (TPR) repeat protein
MAEHFIPRDAAEKGLLECAAFLAENIQNSDGHSEALRTIVPLYLRRGDVDLAAELANSVEDPFTRDKLLILAAEKCASIDDDEYAVQLADAIEDDGLRGEAFERLALQKSAKGDLAKADEMANDLVHPEYVYADIAVRYAALSDAANSVAYLGRIEFPAAKVAAMQAIAELQRNSGERDKAREMLQNARSVATDIEHDEEKLRILGEIGNLFVAFEEKDEAVKTFELMRDAAAELGGAHRNLFLVTAALGFLQAGSLDLADATLDLVTDLTQMASALLGFSREFAKNGDSEEAMESLEEAYSIVRSQRDTEVRDSRARVAVQRMVAVQFAELGKAERAIEVAHEIGEEGEQASALGLIAQVLVMENKESSEQALRGIKDDANRLFALIGVSDVLRKSGENERSIEVLREASTLSETLHQLSARSNILNAIAARFAEYGEPAEAAAAMHENLEIIFQIRNESSRAVALANAAEIYDNAGLELSEEDRKILSSMARRIEW